MHKFEIPNYSEDIIAIIGIGGGGCNAVNHMYNHKIPKLEFWVMNTDSQSLSRLSVTKQLLIGPKLTQGRGSGAIPSVGRKAALESSEEIKEVVKKYKMIFLCAGMGGGTGTGACPVVAEIAKDLGILTVALVTIPFTFEGSHRHNQGVEGIEGLKMCADSIVVIPNDHILKEYGSLSMSKAFYKIDELIFQTIKGIVEAITIPGYINVDFEDVKTIFRDAGLAVIGQAVASGTGRASAVFHKAITSSSLGGVNLRKAEKVLLNIVSGADAELQMDELDEITGLMQELCKDKAEVIFGHGIDKRLKSHVKLSIIGVLGNTSILNNEPEQDSVKIDMPSTVLEPYCEKLRSDYPNQKIAFLIMQFKNTPIHKNIDRVIKDHLKNYNIIVLRADDKEYSDDLLTNILTYIHVADFGIAIYDRITEDDFNPNVSFEVGYMMGINKKVCLLKDQTLRTLPSDLAGKIYQPFDVHDLNSSIKPIMDKWLIDKGFV